MWLERIIGRAGQILRRQEGIAAVELALILPVLIVLLFGVIEIGRLLTDFHAVNKSLRDAARYLTHVGMTCPSAGSGSVSAYLDDAGDEGAAINLAMRGSTDPEANLLLAYWSDAGTVTVTVECVDNEDGSYRGIYSGRPYIPRIVMNASVPFSFLFGTLVLDNPTLTMTFSHTQIHIGA